MKKIVLFFCMFSFLTTSAQYSNYYSLDVNQNINERIDVSGNLNVNKNISTIDYGQLAIANAQRERNRLESIKYANERERTIAIEIASDPLNAYKYGYEKTFTLNGKDAKEWGFKRFTISYRSPNDAIFVMAGDGRYENVSLDGVTTEITFNGPVYEKENQNYDIEKAGKMENVKEGEINENMGVNGEGIFVHKKDLNRATVYGIQGYKSTLIWEDDYQNTITDNYVSLDKNEGYGILFSVKVRTYGDKDEVTFEQLEGRRYYLRRLVERIISTAFITNVKY